VRCQRRSSSHIDHVLISAERSCCKPLSPVVGSCDLSLSECAGWAYRLRIAGDGASEILQGQGCCVFDFCAVVPRNEAGAARRYTPFGNRRTIGKTPAQVLLAWAVQRGTVLLPHPKTPTRARENLNISASRKMRSKKSIDFRSDRGSTKWVKAGIPSFIAQGR
jgi:hypothetical protein